MCVPESPELARETSCACHLAKQVPDLLDLRNAI